MKVFVKITSSEDAAAAIRRTNANISPLDLREYPVPGRGDIVAYPCDEGRIQFTVRERAFDFSSDGDITLVLDYRGIDSSSNDPEQ